eukprot:scaffold326317_cov28-Attheya_sp.AAC.1
MTLTLKNKRKKKATALTLAEKQELKEDFQISYNKAYKKESLVVTVGQLTQVLRIPKNQTETVIDCKFFGTLYTHNETATKDNFKTYKGPGLPEGTRWSYAESRIKIFLDAFDEMLNASAIDGMLNESVITG